jgi:tetratricopeptide (TPR) repeat protein
MDEVIAALEVISGPRAGTRISVSSGEFLLGRGASGPGSLEDDPTLSYRHALIRRGTDGEWTVEDLGSTNGTLLNGVSLTKLTRLSPGDVLRVGGSELRWSLARAKAPAATVAVARTERYPSPDPGSGPAGGPANSADLARARELFGRGRYLEAAQSFARLTSVPAVAIEACFGLGMALFAQDKLDEADRAFMQCLGLDPRHANALYQRGVICERRGDLNAALENYRAAVASNPAHVSGLRALERLSRSAAPPAAAPQRRYERDDVPDVHAAPPAAAGPIDPVLYGVYEYLRLDPATISKHAVALMDRLEMEVRPSFSAYIGHFLRGVIRSTFIVILSLTVVFPLIALIVGFIRVKNIRLRIAQGRLQIEKGVFSKRLTNVDLWRVRNIELYRTFLNRMTGGHGTLVLTLNAEPAADKRHHGKKHSRSDQFVEVTGLAKADRLDEIFQQLLNLTFLLRGNPIVKGIIQ